MAHCNDCGVNVHEIKEHSYRLKEKVWKGTGLDRGFLCIGCAEQRLGRKLKSKDFAMEVAINYWFVLQSDRLRDRLFGLNAQVFIRRLLVANFPELKDELNNPFNWPLPPTNEERLAFIRAILGEAEYLKSEA